VRFGMGDRRSDAQFGHHGSPRTAQGGGHLVTAHGRSDVDGLNQARKESCEVGRGFVWAGSSTRQAAGAAHLAG